MVDNRSTARVDRSWSFKYGHNVIKQYDNIDRPFTSYFEAACLMTYFANEVVYLTNAKIEEKRKTMTEDDRRDAKNLTLGELFIWIGIVGLLTQCEFSDRGDCWNVDNENKDPFDLLPSPQLGKYMSRHRFEFIRSVLTVSKQDTSQSTTADEMN